MSSFDPSECATFYHTYTSKVPTGDIIEILQSQLEETSTLLQGMDETKARYRYAPGKWSIKEMLGHMIDTERIFSYRAMCMARKDPAPLPGMEQDDYVRNADFDNRPLAKLGNEYRYLRLASIELFDSFDEEVQLRRGVASDCEFSVRAFAYIIAGHERHHLDFLKEKYL